MGSWSTRKWFKLVLVVVVPLTLMVWLGWRMVRPMNVFDVTPFFAKPIPITTVPAVASTLSAQECGACHTEMYDEWQTSIHSQAWTDPYFQADFKFDREQQICKNCHTPLAWQQEMRVIGFEKGDLTKPKFEPNADYNQSLQHEGVTCAACHYQDGQILGPFGLADTPHPVKKLNNSNEICLRCHVAPETRHDVFVKFPLCGTVAELLESDSAIDDPRHVGASGEIAISTVSKLNCVECHMPATERPLVTNGITRKVRRHTWRGGHDLDMVKSGVSISFAAQSDNQTYRLSLLNSGASHYIPTGIPDRHIKASIRLVNSDGHTLVQEEKSLLRTFFWRPFIIQKSDTRLKPGETQALDLRFDADKFPDAVAVEAVVTFHLLDEKRRILIDYQNENPISYEIFRERVKL